MNLREIYRQIPYSTCPPGCGECCGAVYPARVEIRNIKNWCKQRGIEIKEFLSPTDNNQCPYLLEDKTCQIYPVRPFMCRIYGVTQHKYLICPDCKTERMLNQLMVDRLYKLTYKGEGKRLLWHKDEIDNAIRRVLRK